MFEIKIVKPKKIHGAIAVIFNKDQSKAIRIFPAVTPKKNK